MSKLAEMSTLLMLIISNKANIKIKNSVLVKIIKAMKMKNISRRSSRKIKENRDSLIK
jgi:hypothetical protein